MCHLGDKNNEGTVFDVPGMLVASSKKRWPSPSSHVSSAKIAKQIILRGPGPGRMEHSLQISLVLVRTAWLVSVKIFIRIDLDMDWLDRWPECPAPALKPFSPGT